MSTANKLKEKSISELREELIALLKEQFNLRMQKSREQSTQTHHFRKVRRAIARVKTILSQKEG